MITTALALLTTRWVQYIIGAIAVVAGLWFGVVSPYNNYVSAKKVIKAEAKKDDFYIPKLKAYEADFKGLTTQINQRIADTNAATEKKLLEVKNEADRKTKLYRAELATQKLVSEQIANERAATDVKRLLDNIKTPACNGTSGQSATDSGGASRFRELYQQCESALDEANGDAAEAISRAAKAEAGLRALVK